MDIDIFVIEIFKADYNSIEQLIEFFQAKNFDHNKKIVFVTHPILWYNSKKNIADNLAQSEIFQNDTQ